MAELVDLDVERVDVVAKPATRKRFMLFKDEDGRVPAAAPGPAPAPAAVDPPAGDPPAGDPEPVVRAGGAAVEKFMAFIQSLDGVALSADQEAMIADILAALDTEAAAKSADPDLETAAEIIAEKVAKALSAAGVPAAIVKAQPTRSARIMASRQGRPAPAGREPVARAAAPGSRKMGEGLFSGVFGVVPRR